MSIVEFYLEQEYFRVLPCCPNSLSGKQVGVHVYYTNINNIFVNFILCTNL